MRQCIPVFLLLAIGTAHPACLSKSGHRNAIASGTPPSEEPVYYAVTKVVDGDTFWVDNGTPKGMKIRLIGVDAPESRKTFNMETGYFGKEAKAYLSGLLDSNAVRLEFDVDSLDQFGRTLAYVYLHDGTFVNAELVKNGYAMVMTVPPNVKYAEEFIRLQQEARENNKGLWKQTD